jgi:peptide/nickel transport system permease protein
MLTFILKRIGSGIVMLFAVTFVAYFLLHLGSGDVARAILGVNATQEQVAQLNEQLGINRPFIVQYGEWLGRLVHFDLGESWSFPDTVTEEVTNRLHVTLTIVTLTTLVSAIFSTVLGVLAAVYGGWIDRFVQFIGLVGFAIPGFLVAFLLVYEFAIQNKIFNAVGWIEFTDDPAGWAKSITLPIIALSLGAIAGTAQQVRGSVKDALNMDYVRTLRARGLSFGRVVYKHILRNAGGPALTTLGMQFVGMMGGAVIVEAIFAIPGLGPFATMATKASDIPATMGLVVVTAIIVIVVNLVIDLLTAALNPKVRLS